MYFLYRTTKIRRVTRCGTLDYLPPEIVNSKAYDETIDIWTLGSFAFLSNIVFFFCINFGFHDYFCGTGVLAYEFLVGVPPFESQSEEATHKRIYTYGHQYLFLVFT